MDIASVYVNPHVLIAHVLFEDQSLSAFSFEHPEVQHPGLALAIAELSVAVTGAITIRMQEAIKHSTPKSPEASELIKVGFCYMCKEPVSTDDPGIRVNGPFFYCPKHSRM